MYLIIGVVSYNVNSEEVLNQISDIMDLIY